MSADPQVAIDAREFRQSGMQIPLPRIVTTSWDDADFSDLRIADLLYSRRLSGTFYTPITGHHGPRAMGRQDLVDLQRAGFEIGAHGLSHLVLPQCDRRQLTREVEYCKAHLEQMLGEPVRMFAYPRGRYTGMTIRSVKRAGYLGARTTQMLAQGFCFDPFRMPTTVHVYPHSLSDYVRNSVRAAAFGGAWKYLKQLRQAGSWVALAKALFNLTLQEGGIWHLYGHSWEVAELSLWDDLEEVLDYVSGREGVQYLSNGATIGSLPASRDSLRWKDVCSAEK